MTLTLRVLSLGAGVQSTALLLMGLHGEAPRPDHVVFADTGWEPAQVYRHLEWCREQCDQAGVPFHLAHYQSIRSRVQEALQGRATFINLPLYARNSRTGERGILRRQCTDRFKIAPIRRKMRELVGRKGRVELQLGISLDEVVRMKPSRVAWVTHTFPLIDQRITRHGCLYWMRHRGYPEPPRSACIGCPFHSDAYWRSMRDESPEEWAEAVEFDRSIRSIPHMPGGTFYLHPSLEALDAVDLRTDIDRGQGDLFANECEGMCGL